MLKTAQLLKTKPGYHARLVRKFRQALCWTLGPAHLSMNHAGDVPGREQDKGLGTVAAQTREAEAQQQTAVLGCTLEAPGPVVWGRHCF